MRPSLSGFLPVTSLVQYLKLCDCQRGTIKRQDQSDPVTALKQKSGEKTENTLGTILPWDHIIFFYA